MLKFYTGIGSRSTPDVVQRVMKTLAQQLDNQGFTLRSGGADGADAAFEWGSSINEIFLPWRGFNGNSSPLFNTSPDAFAIASTIHPAWNKLTDGAKRLHARNCHQVLGQDLNTPSMFTICFTENGEDIGGTRTAIILSRLNDVPVLNLGKFSNLDLLIGELSRFVNRFCESPIYL